jgi:hypothetical protein
MPAVVLPVPALPAEPWFVDDDGVRFRYGTSHFDEDGSPRGDAYSRAGHPERFAPLHAVADGLVEHLVERYDVAVDDVSEDDADAEAIGLGLGVERAVRLTPVAPDASPLVVVWTDFPGLLLYAGTMVNRAVPVCGCDACDETAASVVEGLTRFVAAVVAGGLIEWSRRPPPAAQDLLGSHAPQASGLGYLLEADDGWESSSVESPWAGVAAARERLASLPGGRWQPWSVRPGTTPDPGTGPAPAAV